MSFFRMVHWTGKGEQKWERAGVKLFPVRCVRFADELGICHAFAARGYLPILFKPFTSPEAKQRSVIYFAVIPGQDWPRDLDWQNVQAENRKCNIDFDTVSWKIIKLDTGLPSQAPSWPSLFPQSLLDPDLYGVLPSSATEKNLSTG